MDFEIVRCLVLAGPGFAKDQLRKYIEEQSIKQELKPFMENRDRIVVAAVSSAYRQSIKVCPSYDDDSNSLLPIFPKASPSLSAWLNCKWMTYDMFLIKEVLAAPAIANQVKSTKAARESKALDDFNQMMAHDSAKAFYGPGHVLAASEVGAIDTLLISDSLFKNSNGDTRKKYVDLVDNVREGGSKVYIFSAAHVSGEQLNLLTGIAAILRYPMPHLEDMEIPMD